MPRAKKLTDGQKQEMREQHQAGASCRDLARQYGVSAMSVSRVVRPPASQLIELPYAPPVLQVLGKLVVLLADPEIWDVDSIQERYAVDHAEAMYWHTYTARHLRLLGYSHLMLWSDEQDSPALARMLKHKAGQAADPPVYARSCTVQQLPDEQAREFYAKNHLQGPPGRVSALHLALVHDQQPVACMTFSSSHVCRGLSGHHLLQRYACSRRVPGGASRLLKAFRREHPGPVISYSDERYAPSGGLYRTLGFELHSRGRPDYRYWRDGRWFAKSSKQRKTLISEGGDPARTERQMAHDLGYKQCYDLGKLTWRLE